MHDAHALVLRPGMDAVKGGHPPSAVPTPSWVRTPRGAWWGNCIWDSLGIAAMLGSDATIETRSGACGTPMRVRIEGGGQAGRAENGVGHGCR